METAFAFEIVAQSLTLEQFHAQDRDSFIPSLMAQTLKDPADVGISYLTRQLNSRRKRAVKISLDETSKRKVFRATRSMNLIEGFVYPAHAAFADQANDSSDYRGHHPARSVEVFKIVQEAGGENQRLLKEIAGPAHGRQGDRRPAWPKRDHPDPGGRK